MPASFPRCAAPCSTGVTSDAKSSTSRDVAHVVARVLRQLGGGDQAHEIDDALEVRRAVGANVRLRCSRVTPSAAASSCRCGRSARPARRGSATPLLQRRRRGRAPAGDRAARRRSARRTPGGSTRSRSTVVVDAFDDARPRNRARRTARSAGDSVARSGVSAKNGTLGNSRASSAARHVSSRGRADVDERRVDERACGTSRSSSVGGCAEEQPARRRGNAARASGAGALARERARRAMRHGRRASRPTRHDHRAARSSRARCSSRCGCRQRRLTVVRAARPEHLARVRVRHRGARVVERLPPAGGDALRALRRASSPGSVSIRKK